MQRRDFLTGSALSALAATSLLSRPAAAADSKEGSSLTGAAQSAPAATGPFPLPPLPWAEDALAPVISANTVSFHYGKHHKGYADNLNGIVNTPENAAFAKMTLSEVIQATRNTDKKSLFNNAAQLSHHTFYWESMKPGGGAPPPGALADLINKGFGSYDAFKAKWIDSATKLFGAGWCWLTLADGALKIEQTSNADLPAGKPLLVIDVWEHAYYLDWQNRRKDYATGWTEKLIDWERAAARLAAK